MFCPVTVTLRTPSMPDSSGTAMFSTRRLASSREASEATARSSTGMSSVLPVMTSVSTSSGSVGLIPSTALRMSATTLSGSRPYSHSTVIVAIPLEEVD